MILAQMRTVFFSFVIAAFFACSADSKQNNAPRLPDQAVPDTSYTAKNTRGNLWKNHGCDLITDTELANLFNMHPKEDVLNSRTLPDQAFCLRTWNKPDWKERETYNEKDPNRWLDPQNRVVLQVFGYATNEHGKQQLEMLRRDRRNTYEEDVSGLGDDALWSTTTQTLLVRKGHLVVSIAIVITDNPHDNLEPAKKLAEIALKKM